MRSMLTLERQGSRFEIEQTGEVTKLPSGEFRSRNMGESDMDTIEQYKIQESLMDAIRILDSAPIRVDMVWETNAIQITNRAPIAHLAIEKGLKALIAGASGNQAWGHSLNKLYRRLGRFDKDSADYLASAFDDAVNFYGFNPNSKGLGYLSSLDAYLSKVGTEKAFEALRYWAIEDSSEAGDFINLIWLPIHREILWSQWCSFLPSRRDKVSDRVENRVSRAMFDGRHIVIRSNDKAKEQSVQAYKKWLFEEHSTWCDSLEDAVKRKFLVMEDEFVNQTVRDAFDELRQSEDPAIQYYISTLYHLPEGSQLQDPNAVPEVTWFNEEQTHGAVVTPAGTRLGNIVRYINGGWGITPNENGPLGVREVAKALKDAKAYLVNRLTKRVILTADEETRHLRVISKDDSYLPFQATDVTGFEDLSSDAQVYRLEFWDSNHGLSTGDWIRAECGVSEYDEVIFLIEGTVENVAEQKVMVRGSGNYDARTESA